MRVTPEGVDDVAFQRPVQRARVTDRDGGGARPRLELAPLLFQVLDERGHPRLVGLQLVETARRALFAGAVLLQRRLPL